MSPTWSMSSSCMRLKPASGTCAVPVQMGFPWVEGGGADLTTVQLTERAALLSCSTESRAPRAGGLRLQTESESCTASHQQLADQAPTPASTVKLDHAST